MPYDALVRPEKMSLSGHQLLLLKPTITTITLQTSHLIYLSLSSMNSIFSWKTERDQQTNKRTNRFQRVDFSKPSYRSFWHGLTSKANGKKGDGFSTRNHYSPLKLKHFKKRNNEKTFFERV